MVPPRGRMPDVLERVSSVASSSSTPAQPWLKPRKLCSPSASPRRTTARITAFSPGQSPPPVSSPIRIAEQFSPMPVPRGVEPGSDSFAGQKLVREGRQAPVGIVLKQPVGEHPGSERRPSRRVLIAERVRVPGRQRGREGLLNRGELELPIERRIGLDDERGRRGGVGPDRVLALRERLQERAQILTVGVCLFF